MPLQMDDPNSSDNLRMMLRTRCNTLAIILFRKFIRMEKGKFLLLIFYFFLSYQMHAQTFKAPSITGKTLDGRRVDSSYFANKLTMVSFFYIGCAPCMKEIPVLNKLKEYYKSAPFQILAIAPHTPSQLRLFNAKDTTAISKVVSKQQSEKINYDILPECGEDSAPGSSQRCHQISGLFGVSSYPTSVFINAKGEIVMTTEGFPMRENDQETLQEMIKLIDGFLK